MLPGFKADVAGRELGTRENELRQLIQTQAFARSFGRLVQARRALEGLTALSDDAQCELLLDVGRYEELAALAGREQVLHDNDFEDLSEFAQQCERRNRALCAVHAAERRLESLTVDDASAAARAADELRRLRNILQVESWREASIWRHVQASWKTVARARLAKTEYVFMAARARQAARRHYERHSVARLPPAHPGWLRLRRAELVAQMGQLINEVEQQFGCLVVETFMYWLHRDGTVYCIPLVDDWASLNIQVRAGRVYVTEVRKGVTRLEPLSPDDLQPTDDPRLTDFFGGAPSETWAHRAPPTRALSRSSSRIAPTPPAPMDPSHPVPATFL